MSLVAGATLLNGIGHLAPRLNSSSEGHLQLAKIWSDACYSAGTAATSTSTSTITTTTTTTTTTTAAVQ